MIVHGKAIGVMTVGNHRKRRVFDEEMGNVVNALADYAAIAIVNARLFSALDKRAQLAYAKMQEHDQKIAETLLKPVAHLHHQLQQLANIDRLPEGVTTQLLQCSLHTEQIEQFVQQLRAAPTSQ
jgi:GAF domain-containing protein